MTDFKYDYDNPGPCCQKIKDMINYARPMIGRWPPFYRYTLGEQILNEMLLMLRLATKARLRWMNKSTLADLDTSKEVLKAFVEEANSTIFTDKSGNKRRLLSDHSFGEWSAQIEVIGKLIGAWINSVSGRKNNKGNVP